MQVLRKQSQNSKLLVSILIFKVFKIMCKPPCFSAIFTNLTSVLLLPREKILSVIQEKHPVKVRVLTNSSWQILFKLMRSILTILKLKLSVLFKISVRPIKK